MRSLRHRPPLLFFCTLSLLAISGLAHLASTAQAQEPDITELYKKQVVHIPMRDGVKLYTEIYTPVKSKEPVPFLLERTVYHMSHRRKGFHSYLLGSTRETLAAEGYIFVWQYIRGRFESEGEFVMVRPPRDPNDPKAIDESTDTFDTIEWLLRNVPNHNGRVGVLGRSYMGWTTIMAIIDPHPAIKCANPEGAMGDVWMGDDFGHYGALRLSPAFGYAYWVEATGRMFDFGGVDTYDWFLKLGSLANVNTHYFHNKAPSWNALMEHPNYDEYWQKRAVPPYLTAPKVPTLNVAGWWDAEDFYGPMKIYETLEKNDPNNMNYLVVGPWQHSGWHGGEGQHFGTLDFGSPTTRYYREQLQGPWFAYFLKDKGQPNLPEARVFLTGTNRWESMPHWPPQKNVTERKLYFHAQGRLSFDPPPAEEKNPFDQYVSDPANPVPYQKRPLTGFWQGRRRKLWKVEDQRFLEGRSDIASWQTEPLTEDLIVSGKIVAHLFASTTGTDSDWIVKLIDVYPEKLPEDPVMQGFQLMIAGDVLRGKFRNSFEKPEPIEPGKITAFQVELNSRNHCFRKGHRIMVQVQSSWFPLIARNPQKFITIPTAKAEDYQKATQRIHRSSTHPSHLQLPIHNSK